MIPGKQPPCKPFPVTSEFSQLIRIDEFSFGYALDISKTDERLRICPHLVGFESTQDLPLHMVDGNNAKRADHRSKSSIEGKIPGPLHPFQNLDDLVIPVCCIQVILCLFKTEPVRTVIDHPSELNKPFNPEDLFSFGKEVMQLRPCLLWCHRVDDKFTPADFNLPAGTARIDIISLKSKNKVTIPGLFRTGMVLNCCPAPDRNRSPIKGYRADHRDRIDC